VRALAVLLVVITHWFPETHPLNQYTSFFNGVDIFFVLSGFLITKILLQNRNKAEETGTRTKDLVKSFFIRRFLRIFPIYYLTIFILFILGSATGTSIRSSIGYFITYTSNFYFFQRGAWDGMLSHLWSLSVEEQFYLIWPWLILLVKKKHLLPVILAAIFIGVASQLYLQDIPFSDILTFACFDGFGLGALLAWLLVYRPRLLTTVYGPAFFLAVVSAGLQVMRVVSDSGMHFLPSRTLTSLFTVWVILSILLQKHNKYVVSKTVLNSAVLIFIGRISYGIYLYHLIIPYLTVRPLTYINRRLFPGFFQYNFYLFLIENLVVLLVLSYASWRFIEQPALTLKKHFEYQRLPRFSNWQVRKQKESANA